MYKINLHILQSPDLQLVLSQLGHLTLDCVKNHPKKSNLLKKLAFAEVYNLDHDNQVTLLFTSKLILELKMNSFGQNSGLLSQCALVLTEYYSSVGQQKTIDDKRDGETLVEKPPGSIISSSYS